MTDPREEIKRLAGIYARAMSSWVQHEDDDGRAEYLERCRAALHAAIDAIPNYQSLSAEIRNLEIALAKAHDAYGQLLVRRNLTDAALEGAPSGDYSANGEPLYHPPESKGDSHER